MAHKFLESDLVKIFHTLSEIMLSSKDKNEALKNIVNLCQEAMGSQACTLTLLDFDSRALNVIASDGFDVDIKDLMSSKGSAVNSTSGEHSADYNLHLKGKVLENYLPAIDQGRVKYEGAQNYDIKAALSHPLISEGVLIGYLNHFSSKSHKFDNEERKLLKIFAQHAVIAIEKADYQQALERSVRILDELSQNLFALSTEDFLSQAAAKGCELLSVPICVVWKSNTEEEMLEVAAIAGVDEKYKELKIDCKQLDQQGYLWNEKTFYLSNIEEQVSAYAYLNEAILRGWQSLMRTPIHVGDHLAGIIEVYTKTPRVFKKWEKDLFVSFASQLALLLQKTQLLRESEKSLIDRNKLEKLTETQFEMSESHHLEGLLRLLLDRSLTAVGATKGMIRLLDYGTGKLEIAAYRGELLDDKPLRLGEGAVGRAIQLQMPVLINDVRKSLPEVEGKFSETSGSLIAIPILISKAEVRTGREIKYGPKPIGVLSLESPKLGAFSQTDMDYLLSLARHASAIFEKLEFDHELSNLRQIEKEIIGLRDYDQIIQIVLKGITKTLKFEYVNISLVVPELKLIRSEYVTGIPKNQIDKFKQMAVYPLDSRDIQADIVRSMEIEVPEGDDARFDHALFKQFRHNRFIRVFIPMVASSDNRVIGTVEAGYRREYRNYIYERDIQILKGFVDYAVQALEQKNRGLLDKISHEFKAPIVGIRNNASFLQRRHNDLSNDFIDSKFNDILTDCEILLYQVGELEHILGRPSPISKREKTYVYKDVIIKNINQLKPLIAERGFSPSRISYNPADSTRINIFVDKTKLNQVVYNLLMNSIKYADNDPESFKIILEVAENSDAYIIKFKDWGIGITDGLQEKIFNEGFRTPEAIRKNVAGSGLGLSIARQVMRVMGGDLRLAHLYKPTEFHLILPKKLREVPNDTIR